MLNHNCHVSNTKKPACVFLSAKKKTCSLYISTSAILKPFPLSQLSTFHYILIFITQKNLCILLLAYYHQLKGLLFQYLGTSKPLATLDTALHSARELKEMKWLLKELTKQENYQSHVQSAVDFLLLGSGCRIFLNKFSSVSALSRSLKKQEDWKLIWGNIFTWQKALELFVAK